MNAIQAFTALRDRLERARKSRHRMQSGDLGVRAAAASDYQIATAEIVECLVILDDAHALADFEEFLAITYGGTK